MSSACPILPARDLGATEAFYARLGFRRGALHEARGYLILGRDAVELHFFRAPEHDPATCDHGAYLRLEDAGTLSEEWAALGLPDEGIPRLHGAQDKPWGMRELAVVDPDGNLIRAGTPL